MTPHAHAVTMAPNGAFADQGTPRPGEGAAPAARDRAALLALGRRVDPGDAGAQNNLGVLYFNKRLLPEAIEAFEGALELEPDLAVARTNLELAIAEWLRGGGALEALVDDGGARGTLDAEQPRAARRRARLLWLGGERDAGGAELDRALALHPRDVETLLELSALRRADGRAEEALEILRRAAMSAPSDARVLVALANGFVERGRPEEARRVLERAEIHAPADPRVARARDALEGRVVEAAPRSLSVERYAYERGSTTGSSEGRPVASLGASLTGYHEGVGLREAGEYEAAAAAFQRALEAGEDPELLRTALAEVRLLLGDAAAAAALYEGVLEGLETPKLRNELGVALHLSGDLSGARAAYGEALALDPGHALAWNNLGVVCVADADEEGALECFQRASALREAFAEALCNLGLLRSLLRRPREAFDAYRAAIDARPGSATGWVGVGTLLAEAGRLREGRNALVRAVELAPSSAEARYPLAFVLSRMGDYDAALAETERALDLDPFYSAPRFRLAIDVQFEDAEVLAPELARPKEGGTGGWRVPLPPAEVAEAVEALRPATPRVELDEEAVRGVRRARADLASGRFEQALAELARVATDDGEAGEVALLTGETYLRLGLDGEALERFDLAIRALNGQSNGRSNGRSDEEGMAAAWLGRARATLRLGRLEEAREAAARAADHGAPERETLVVIGDSWLRSGRAVQALHTYQALVERDPTDASALFHLALAAEATGRRRLALAAAEEALELDPDLPAAHLFCARAHLLERRLDEARTACTAALACLPGYPDALLLRARIEEEAGQAGAAVDSLVELLAADGYHHEALCELARLLLELGRAEDARRAALRAVRLQPDSAEATRLLARARATHHAPIPNFGD